MPILRKKTRSNYTVIDNGIFTDQRLSAKAKGVLCVLLHLSDDWAFNEDGLLHFFSDGKASIRAALDNLEEVGYLLREQPQRDDGTFEKWVWYVSEEPLFENLKVDENQPVCENQKAVKKGLQNPRSKPLCDLPLSEKPLSENRKLTNTNRTNTKKTSTKDNRETISSVVSYLNDKAGKKYRADSKTTARHINARLNEGYTLKDFQTVIDTKTAQWKNDQMMARYLRPETLFGSKFESYLNEGGQNDYSDFRVR